MSLNTKSWQLKHPDEDHEKLRKILEKWGFDDMTMALREIKRNIFEMDERRQEPDRLLKLRVKRRS